MPRAPVAICRTSDLPEAGAYWTLDAGGTPILACRNAQGTVRAFVNLCRHRGVRLVHERQGVTKMFSCLLHGWTYDADGHMGGAVLGRLARDNPMLAALRDTNALTPLASELRHGFVWVAPNPRVAIDVAAFLGPADAELAARDLTAFAVRERHERSVGADELLAAVEPGLRATDAVRVLSEDLLVVFHADGTIALFTLARRRPETDFGEGTDETVERRTLEHMLLTPP